MKIPAVILKNATKVLTKTQKNSPTILLATGVVGAVASTVMACRATLQLEEVLKDHLVMLEDVKTIQSEKYSDLDRRKDLAIVRTRVVGSVIKLYGPSVTLGLLSLTCLVSSHRILNTRNAALMAGYSALEKSFERYRERVVKEIGEDKERELRYDTVDPVEVVDKKTGKTFVDPQMGASPYARFFDEYSTNWNPQPMYNQMFLRCQQNYANDLLKARGHVFLNDVFDMLGISRTPAGAVTGWILEPGSDGDNYIDFGVFDGDVYTATRFVNGDEQSILLDFNVDGQIYHKI